MSQRGSRERGVVTDAGRSRAATALFVLGVLVVATNSALYFFDFEAVSDPAVSVLGVALMLPLYLKKR